MLRKLSSPALAVGLLATVLPALAVASPAPPDPEDMRLLRRPDIHGDRVVFGYAGDLWLVASQGGAARRLTSTVGYLTFPKFSPDGNWIAFTGNYDGNEDVYVIPAAGGEPKRLTWHPGYDRVIDWQPDGQAIRFQSARESLTGRDIKLFTVAVDGGLPVAMVLPTGGLSSYSPDGERLAYNRITREHRTWKRYQGGMAQDVWIYDFAANDTRRLTDWAGTDSFPMWHGDTIYFLSDRTGRLQIWAHELTSGQERQVTRHEDYDVKWPSLGPGAIVYEHGGWLHLLDLASERSRQLRVAVHADNVLARPTLIDVDEWITSADLAPGAQRAVLVARGDIFTLPAAKGNVRNLTQTPGVRERGAVWSPDGEWIAYFSDRDGEYEVYVRAADGSGDERRLTDGDESWMMGLAWSPDSRHLLMHDAGLSLWLIEVEKGGKQRIDRSVSDEIRDFAWSHDGRWVAYAKAEENGFRSIFLYDLDRGDIHRVTTDFTDESAPCFDSEGKYLFFVSARAFNPTLGGFDLKPLWVNQDGIYVATLRADEPSPFPPESDEVGSDEEEQADQRDGEKHGKKGDDKKDEDEQSEVVEPLVVDLEGLGERIVALDVPPSNYRDLAFGGGKLFYLDRPFAPNGGRDNREAKTAIMVFDLEEREAEQVLGDVAGYELSRDGKKLLYIQRQNSKPTFGIIDAKADQEPADEPLRTGDMRARIDPRAEWQQMFQDAWRLERDFFYDPELHQVDWPAMRERYGQLVPYVGHPLDFSYLLGELVGELNCSHSYVRPGDLPEVKQVAVGLLGCDFGLDAGSGRYRLTRIFTDRDWDKDVATPLNVPGNEVNPGDYLLVVDGVELRAPTNPLSRFEARVGEQVVLRVGPRADGKESREITVVPVASDAPLRYEAWVAGNRRRVDELSGGRIGYLHLPNTAVGGQEGFARGYYPQLRKDGLIIDERFNGGGFIPDFFMNILRQKLVNLWKPRHGQDWRTPGTAFLGHLAMVSNGYAGSGGDALPYYFKAYELGPVIGTRTWGGLVGISSSIPLMDGGQVTMPEFGLFNLAGEPDVENHGVEPDIEVDNLPHQEIAGRDPQLEKAVEVLLQRIAAEPVQAPRFQGFPKDRN